LILLLAWPALAGSQQVATTSTFTVSLPLNVSPETVLIEAGIFGQGLHLSQVQTKPGVFDYLIRLNDSSVGPAKSLKLLIYIPGYRIVAPEFKESELTAGRVFIPPLVDLRTTIVKGVLLDSSSRPLAGQTLRVDYTLTDAMSYFGYLDGGVRNIPIGSTKTDSKGEFTISVPSLLDDPFFQKSPRFELSTEDGTFFWDPTLNPHSLPAQRTYEPLVIRKTQRGIVSGRLGKEFLQQNGLSGDLRAYVRPGDTIPLEIALRATTRDQGASFNADLQMDGSFEVRLPPGEYDLVLWVSQIEKKIPVQSGFVVEEGKRLIIARP